MVSCDARIDSIVIEDGKLDTVDDWKLFLDSVQSTACNWWSVDDTVLHYSKLIIIARKMKRQHDIDMIGIDYLSFLKGDRDRRQSRVEEIETITRNIKALANELDIPVVLLCQLNRDCEKRENKRPLLSDLRESGAIEQDADAVLFVYRDEVYHSDSEDIGLAEIILSKHRNGPTGRFKMVFTPRYTRFEDLAPI